MQPDQVKQILIKAQQYENRITAEKLALAQKLGTTKGFFQYYFDMLPYFQTQTGCFNDINLLHNKIFKEDKYSDYDSFRKQMVRYLKSRHK